MRSWAICHRKLCTHDFFFLNLIYFFAPWFYRNPTIIFMVFFHFSCHSCLSSNAKHQRKGHTRVHSIVLSKHPHYQDSLVGCWLPNRCVWYGHSKRQPWQEMRFSLPLPQKGFPAHQFRGIMLLIMVNVTNWFHFVWLLIVNICVHEFMTPWHLAKIFS